MAIMEIVTWPAKVLETKAAEVTVFDQELATLAQNMHATMDHAGGIGLAANQVGLLKRLLVIHIPHEGKTDKPWHKSYDARQPWHNKRFSMVNPKVVAFAGKFTSMEGCLSFPEQMDYVNRHVHITVDYQDILGKPHSISCDGLMSVCLQHEIDHLNGTLFIDRMNEAAARGIKDRLLEDVDGAR